MSSRRSKPEQICDRKKSQNREAPEGAAREADGAGQDGQGTGWLVGETVIAVEGMAPGLAETAELQALEPVRLIG